MGDWVKEEVMVAMVAAAVWEMAVAVAAATVGAMERVARDPRGASTSLLPCPHHRPAAVVTTVKLRIPTLCTPHMIWRRRP